MTLRPGKVGHLDVDSGEVIIVAVLHCGRNQAGSRCDEEVLV